MFVNQIPYMRRPLGIHDVIRGEMHARRQPRNLLLQLREIGQRRWSDEMQAQRRAVDEVADGGRLKEDGLGEPIERTHHQMDLGGRDVLTVSGPLQLHRDSAYQGTGRIPIPVEGPNAAHRGTGQPHSRVFDDGRTVIAG